MVWEPADTVGLLSTIIGSLWFIIAPIVSVFVTGPYGFLSMYQLLMLIGGALFLIMGIAAVANDSKIGIGGIICGSLWVLIGITYFLIPRGPFF
jgi:hypothetical protein